MTLPRASVCSARRSRRRSRASLAGLVAAATAAAPASAAAQGAAEVDFTNLSLEELMDVEVTSVSKRPQRVADAAAAVFVIGPEDIRRSGANSVPELLRMVPGVEVARIDANKWAVSIRGFNGQFSSKVQVLTDGRSVYNTLFSGVFWEGQDVVLEDVERIEVIRGPSASVWGANAMNGVINIITKSAKDTQGVLLSGGLGTGEHGFGTARFGGKLGEKLHYRGYAKSFTVGEGAVASGNRGADETRQDRAGFRIDAEPSSRDLLTLSGDLYKHDYGSTELNEPSFTPPFFAVYDERGKSSGGNILGRWSRQVSKIQALALQAYYDRFQIREVGISTTTEVADVDFQHTFKAFERNRIGWGLGYRYTRTGINDSPIIRASVSHREDSLLSTFIQDEISLIEDELCFIIGSKVEHNDSTGVEVQPAARVLWSPTPTQSAWAAVSRAVRLPHIGEQDTSITGRLVPPFTAENPTPFPAELALSGNPDVVSEDVLSFELGYRAKPFDKLSFDATAFYNVYEDLRGFVVGEPFLVAAPTPRIVLPAQLEANDSAETWGVEAAADWELFSWWRLKAAYTFLRTDLSDDNLSRGRSPLHQASLRSMLDLGRGWEFDLWPRYVDNLSHDSVNSYVDLDARLGWRPTNAIEFSLVGQNLLDSRRKETFPDLFPITPTQAERAAYGKLTLRF
ncbi:MAG: TonB-dependent receptor [Rhodospirillales bacterium]|nr:TonB-dependent receptor [Rhodospirillales bacterium]